jgi:putative Mg2+ transporter-C (MgtC) family protein
MEYLSSLFSGLPDTVHVLRVVVRLLAAALLGGVLGLERLREGKEAGIRTHALVAMGAAVFTLTTLESGAGAADLSRVIQGVAAGVGFLGAGTILKLTSEHKIEGLTTAATIWLTAAIGMAVGAGWIWPAVCGVFLAWIVLAGGHPVERLSGRKQGPEPPAG